MKCRICGNTKGNCSYEVKEQMYGTGEAFTYFQCGMCGCLQIVEIPTDMTRYYEQSYYSLDFSPGNRGLKSALERLRNRYQVLNEGMIGRLLTVFFPKRDLASIQPVGLTRDSMVVDVGCGAGDLPYRIKQSGVDQVLGIDPFIEKDLVYDNGTVIEKKTIFDLETSFDLIMFHHSFEHMSEQLEILAKARSILKPGGTILIRIPTVSSYAWRRYGMYWVNLDAPRHFFLHSFKSVQLLAEKAGLEIYHHYYDSWSIQFWGSEQYEQGIPLNTDGSYGINPERSVFTQADIAWFERRSAMLNAMEDGDAVSLYLRAK